MAIRKRIAVTLPAGYRIEDTVERIKWAEANGYDDAWFGDSFAPHQHLQIAQSRALESSRPIIRAANTGISAVIDKNGNILNQIQLYR